MPPYVSSPFYAVDIGAHVFPTAKYGLVCERLEQAHGWRADDRIEPAAAAAESVLRVHEPGYFARCRDGRLSLHEQLQLELPWSPALYDASVRCVEGSIVAARQALEAGVGIHVGGGFHHAFADHGEGFCVFNDIACAIEAMREEGRVERALVADCDLHHGNGTAAIFADRAEVDTYSIHQQDIYPAIKPPSTVDVGLPAGTGDDTYLHLLRESLAPMFSAPGPDLVAYVAGADPFVNDQLGSLRLTMRGLAERDRIVVDLAERHAVPLLLVLAGGYAHEVEDTVAIHVQSVLAAERLRR